MSANDKCRDGLLSIISCLFRRARKGGGRARRHCYRYRRLVGFYCVKKDAERWGFWRGTCWDRDFTNAIGTHGSVCDGEISSGKGL